MNSPILLTALILGGILLPIACHKPESHEVQVMKWLDKADPVKDARQALAKGDHTLRAVCGLGVSIPGTNQNDYERLKEQFGFTAIEGTSDCLVSEEHHRLNAKAYSYAEAYNRYIMKEFKPIGAN